MDDSEATRLYSPNQVAISTLIAGPLAGSHLLWSNFRALKKQKLANFTVIVGLVVFVALVVAGLFVSKRWQQSGLFVGVVVAVIARQVAESRQLNKQAISDSDDYNFQSGWKVLGFTLGWVAVTTILAFAVAFVLIALGAKT